MKKYNNYFKINEKEMYGVSSNKGNKFYFDLEDYEKIKNYCWWEAKSGHLRAVVPKTKKKILLHRLILNFPESKIDHINRNPKDNRKINLRLANNQQNASNITIRTDNNFGYIGIRFIIKINKWAARIGYNYKQIHLGVFENIEDAIISRLKAEKLYFKEFAPQKHLFKIYKI